VCFDLARPRRSRRCGKRAACRPIRTPQHRRGGQYKEAWLVLWFLACSLGQSRFIYTCTLSDDKLRRDHGMQLSTGAGSSGSRTGSGEVFSGVGRRWSVDLCDGEFGREDGSCDSQLQYDQLILFDVAVLWLGRCTPKRALSTAMRTVERPRVAASDRKVGRLPKRGFAGSVKGLLNFSGEKEHLCTRWETRPAYSSRVRWIGLASEVALVWSLNVY
jgi:hypothetical protein